jgi:hypothetical protein
MTHDELLEKIDNNLSNCGGKDDCESCKRENAPWVALGAVAKLHKPEGINAPPQCKHDRKAYPCPTIQAIEKELN